MRSRVTRTAPLLGILVAAAVLITTVSEGVAGPTDKLPSGASFRLRELDRILVRGERVMGDQSTTLSTDYRVKTAMAAVEQGRAKMDEIWERFGDQISKDNAEMKAADDRINSLEASAKALQAGDAAQAAEAQAAAADKEAASADWLAKLRPFVIPLGRPDHAPERYLIPSATQEDAEMAKRLAIYTDADAALKAFGASAEAAKKTDELAQVEQDLERALKEFAASCKEYAALDLDEAARKLSDAADFMARQEAKIGTSEPVLPIHKDVLSAIRKLIDRGATAAGPEDPRPAQLTASLADLERRDGALRQARIDQTVMTPDKFTGDDLDQVKSKAGEFLLEEYTDATVLRTTVISSDWKEESRWEPTDGTYSAIRYRTTRSVTVQIAGKRGSNVFLYTLDVARDKQSDGKWGPYYGHVMFIDPMRESNVNK